MLFRIQTSTNAYNSSPDDTHVHQKVKVKLICKV